MNIILPIAITLGIMVVLLAALSLTLAYRSRRSTPTSPYVFPQRGAKVAKLGYFSMQQGKRIAQVPPTVPVEPAQEDKESA